MAGDDIMMELEQAQIGEKEQEQKREGEPLLSAQLARVSAQSSHVRGLFASSVSFLTNHSDFILRISHGTVWLIALALAVEHRLLTFKVLEYLLPSVLTLSVNTSMSMTYGFALRRRLIEQKEALGTLKGQLGALQGKTENLKGIIKNLKNFSTAEKTGVWESSFKEILKSVANKQKIIPVLHKKVENAASWKVLAPGGAFLVFTVLQIGYHIIDLNEKFDLWSDLLTPGLAFMAGLIAISLYRWSYKRALNEVSGQLPDLHSDQSQLTVLLTTILKEISLRSPSLTAATAEEKEVPAAEEGEEEISSPSFN